MLKDGFETISHDFRNNFDKLLSHGVKRKKKRSDSPLHQQKCQKGKVITQQRHKKFDYTAVGPTKDGHFE